MDKIRTLIDEATLAAKVKELGRKITERHRGHEVVLVPVLKGSFVFAADLARQIDLPVTIEFLGCRSYEGTESSGVVQITYDLTKPIEGKHVIIVEDIVDTGLTMTYLLENLETRRPASLELCSLLHKPARTRVPVEIHYLGFTIDDVFVVGYGLDYAERFRNVPFIGVLEQGAKT
ncbi:hypoxanthine phosphoribosyltransferase [Sandaracinus amylolyticus]|uniref:hypoxanthine phosphoribosyltransferase n=1 Tax=Sandaracinus amylolyticus TaxID=927083 RepID=UPI001F02136F|nr:hypoxanthine phosphoribosyltransferase [Sandaracinus amylolyticus]UJR81277.1 Hypoxanthine phosphoribosyltransferase [Sandaracinus amylolyticus]